MYSPKKDGRWQLRLILAALGLVVALAPAWASAADLKVDASLGNSPFTVNTNISFSNETVGTVSFGEMNQGAFTNTVNSLLTLGDNAGASGTYNLSGGSLTLNEFLGSELIGLLGSGTFNQTGGTHTVGNTLELGAGAGSSGIYNLSGGSLVVAGVSFEFIGGAGRGTFNQTGGTHTVRDLTLGLVAGSSGTYNLSGGSLTVSDFEPIGYNGSGTFTQMGGTHTVDILDVGFHDGSSGTYNLSGGSLTVGTEGIGSSGGGTFTQMGGAHTVDILNVGLGGSGSYNLSNGSLTVSGERISFFGSGSFTQSGGTHTVGNDLSLGAFAGDSGSYTLSGGSLVVAGVSLESIGGEGRGTFIQTGGTHTVRSLTLGEVAGSSGSYTLSGGSLTVSGDEIIGNEGSGAFTQRGGTHTVKGNLILAANTGSSGTYDLKGGSLTSGTVKVQAGGTFTQSGGSLESGGLANQGSVNLSGGVTTITGDSFNQGTIKVSNTAVTWGGTFTNTGAYISDPATQTFKNLTVESTGYLKGGGGDTFIITGDFLNQSTQNTTWNTTAAYLKFTGGGNHMFQLAGKDMGPNGNTNNFAWGTMDLDEGNTLTLMGNPGSALYVGELLGLSFEDSIVTNIFGNDLNIYYDPSLPENDYLHGLTFELADGGYLFPVPLPPSVWLFLSGLAGLGVLRRRGKGKKI